MSVILYTVQKRIKRFKAPPVTLNMTDLNSDEYDCRRRLSRIHMTGGDLAKYDWRRRLRGGGSGHYYGELNGHVIDDFT